MLFSTFSARFADRPPRFRRLSVAVLLSLLLFPGCAHRPSVHPLNNGDKVTLTYDCRLPGGALAATNNQHIALNEGIRKAGIYSPSADMVPVSVQVRKAEDTSSALPQLLSFDDAIKLTLANALEGRSTGKQQFVLDPGVIDGLKAGNRYLQLARTRRRPKFFELGVEDFKSRIKRPPVVGEKIPYEPGLASFVDSVTADTVGIRIAPDPDGEYVTPFGNGRVIDAGDHYSIPLDVETGRLVRTGNMVGRIVEVKTQYFTVDYGHPFGGEKLQCTVDVKPAAPAASN